MRGRPRFSRPMVVDWMYGGLPFRKRMEIMQTISRAGCVAILILSTPWLCSENRFFFDDETVPAGATGQEFVLRADNDISLYGFSFGVNYDQTAMTITAVTMAGTDAATVDFFDGRIDTVQGLVGYGCVTDLNAPINKLIPAGTNRTLARLTADIIGAAGTSSQLVLESVPTNPDPKRPVKNVMTTDQGRSVIPSLHAGTITIEDRTPVITSITDNAGLAGQVFTVAGDFFGEPGLAVEVCSAAASFVLEEGGAAISVTAPDCGVVGVAEVKVCTIRGCDSDPQGFTYGQKEIDFIRGDSNADDDVDISDGVTILIYLFLGGITTECLDAFDADDKGGVDLTDAVYVFNFLFTGGPDIPLPYPLAGKDPTPGDSLKCLARP